MFAKGRTNYQAMVEDKAESLKLLLSVVPDYISDMKKKIEEQVHLETEEYIEWDEDAKKEIVRTWHPSIDTTIFDDMLSDFYASMIQRIYSFCEICMSELCRDRGTLKPKRGTSKEGQANMHRGPILVTLYKTIQLENGLSLPELDEVWKGYHDFRIDRNRLTHELLVQKYTEDYLKQNLDEIQTLLISTEQAILTNKQ